MSSSEQVGVDRSMSYIEDRIAEWRIDYQALPDGLRGQDYASIVKAIAPVLEAQWCELYRQMTPAQNCIDIIQWDTFNYAYDNPCTIRHHEFVWNQDVEDRAVVVYGISRPVKEKRDKYRMSGPRGEREWGEGTDGYHYDRGHFIAHSFGGQADVGLFPQRRDINQGRSPRGRVYRSMERYCRDTPGVFCFARPIYLDKSDHPFYLEFGVLRPDLTFWVELFENRYTDKLFTMPPQAEAPERPT
jgi:hypothetical protein